MNNKKLEEDKKYFDNYEENRIELEKKIKESKILNDRLINEKQEIIKELDNKKELINEYKSELNELNYKHNQKVQEILKELNDKGISINKLNTLNNEYEQKLQELKNELNDKVISLNEYKKRLNTLSDMYEKEIQQMKKELKESKEYIDSDKKEKSKLMKKVSELSKEQQKYKRKEITEQILNRKEMELSINETKVNDLEYQNKLLNEGFKMNDLKKSIDLKNKESDVINKLSKESEEAKIKRLNIMHDTNRSNTIDDIIKSHKDLSTLTKIPQSIRKRDDKVRTFAPSDNTIKPSFLEDKNLKSINKYENISLDLINKLIDRINNEITEGDNIVDIGNNNKIYFKDLTNFLNDIRNGKINDFNKENEYNKRLKDTEIKLTNRTEFSDFTRLYEKSINVLKRELFTFKKELGKGLTISSLPILLSKMYTNNSSKEQISNIEQLINNLYDNKQITKQVYNILNKSINK